MARRDREEIFLEYTKSVCPLCRVVIDAEVLVRDSKVYLSKRCPSHGRFEALLYSDAEMYMAQLRFNKPGTLPLETQTEVREGCPLDCGLCPDHKQHACLGLIEVNSSCNLDCPVCFADSGHHSDSFSLTREQVERALDVFVAAEGEPEVVMFSGGESTIHPEILDFCEMARSKGVRTVVVNTNGLRPAHDPGFAEALAERGVRVYLQFDGLEESTHVALRGRDLRRAKETALERAADAGLAVMLVAAVERGVNTHELGSIVRYGISHPAVRAVSFQPVTHAGRTPEFDPRNRVTNADVVKALVEQCSGWFRESDFFPVPCCFPTCRSVTYLLADDQDVITLTRLVPMERYLDYVSNRALPDPNIRTLLEGLWSASAVPGSDRVEDGLAQVLGAMDPDGALPELAAAAFGACVACGTTSPTRSPPWQPRRS
ncbi:MAG: hypothetical protein KatS3mg008_1359 [Acidimicrobiales bacterium]|nr:MAG: hypothetical protein KatS3mg008_1359 [Acidimicrobiales bacterium]